MKATDLRNLSLPSRWYAPAGFLVLVNSSPGEPATFELPARGEWEIVCDGERVKDGLGTASDACVVANYNAQGGPDGNTSGFDPSPFGSGWSLLAKLPPAGGRTSLGGVNSVIFNVL